MISYFNNSLNNIWVGLSTDEKKINTLETKNVSNGSLFYEIDTKEIYLFDEEYNVWWPQFVK